MLTAEAEIRTERASRYLVQFCRHADQMRTRTHSVRRGHGRGQPPPEVRNVEWSDTHGVITVDWGQCTLEATSDGLTLHAEAADEQRLRRIEVLVAQRLETIGRRDNLTVTWRTPTGQPEPPATAPHRLRGTTILLAIAAVLAIAAHLGLGGAALANATWLGWSANVILALIAVKVVVVVVLALRRRSRRRRTQPAK